MPQFSEYVGIDYSGAEGPDSRCPGIKIWIVDRYDHAKTFHPDSGKNWSRSALTEFIERKLHGDEPVVVGIDHGFSFPQAYFEDRGLESWDAMLEHFQRGWETDVQPVEAARPKHRRRLPYCLPGHDPRWRGWRYRICEKWTSSAKSVFSFDHNGSVAKSTHAGLPWLLRLRRNLGKKVHFWPFDGFEVPQGKHVVAEVYPSIFRNRYRTELADHDRDAWAVCKWLQEMDSRDLLPRYFAPPLTAAEQFTARLEGWILGVA